MHIYKFFDFFLLHGTTFRTGESHSKNTDSSAKEGCKRNSVVSKRAIIFYSTKITREYTSKRVLSFQKSKIEIKLLKKALPNNLFIFDKTLTKNIV